MKYQKPKLERFGEFRTLTQIGNLDIAQDGGYGGDLSNGCTWNGGYGSTVCTYPSSS